MNPCRTLAAVLSLALAALAQDARPPQHHGGTHPNPRVVTMTRPMATVSRLENELEDALSKSDQATIDKLVKDDFSLWKPAPGGAPVPRQEWLQQAPKLLPVQRRDLAVEALADGQVYVASFVALPRDSKGADHFIVDVWTKSGDSYLLKARYESKVAGYRAAPRRPTGKD